MAGSARRAAAEILAALEKKNSYGNLELKKYLVAHSLSSRDRGLVTQVVYGVLRHKLSLDFALNNFLKKDISRLKPPLRALLRSGAYQILFLTKVPDSAACDESVKLAKTLGFPGLAGLVNAVLRNLAGNRDRIPWPSPGGDPVDYLALTYSFPPWMVERWLSCFSLPEAEELCRALNTPLPLSLRVNTLSARREDVEEELEGQGFQVRQGLLPETLRIGDSPTDLTSTPGYREGRFSIQGETSALAARLLDPRPGQLVVDLCSAPGGKAAHLAQLMEDEGRVVAGDFHPHRRDLVQAAAKRLGLKSIEARVWDARSLPPELHGKAHRVLLDAPCSGLGVLGRKPDLKWQRNPKDFPALARLQGEMLAEGVKLLRPEGLLLYSVCTNEPEETGDLLSAFLRSHPRLEALSLTEALPRGLRAVPEGGGLHIYPHLQGSDGFYFALLGPKQ